MAAKVGRKRTPQAPTVRKELRQIQYRMWQMFAKGESFEEHLHARDVAFVELKAEAARRQKVEGPTELAIVAGRLVKTNMTRH